MVGPWAVCRQCRLTHTHTHTPSPSHTATTITTHTRARLVSQLFFKTNLTFYDKNVPKPPPPGSNVSLSNHSYTMPSFKACLQERDPGMDNIFTVSFQSNYTMSILSFSSNQSMVGQRPFPGRPPLQRLLVPLRNP